MNIRECLAITLWLLASMLVGCHSVHTSRPGAVPVAMWASMLIVDRHGKPEQPELHQTVARVLKEAGLHATIDDAGVSVPEGEERRAREVLLTDKRLSGSSVLVFLAIPAGSGRKTESGFEIPRVAPDEPMGMPTTSGGR